MIAISHVRWIKPTGALIAAVLLLAGHAICQQNNSTSLWPLSAPLAAGAGPDDTPAILLFLPSSHRPTPGVVVCPSGNYTSLSLDRDGRQVAEWLNDVGVAAFVLKYRVGPVYHYPVPLMDAQRALRVVRSNAALYNVLPNEIGIMGFSAGGHLAAMLATQFGAVKSPPRDRVDRASARPDFLVLVYPVVTCSEPFMDASACSNLMGGRSSPTLAATLSPEKHVTAETPPTFIFHAYDDSTVPVENSLVFFTALRKAGVPAELHIFAHGAHDIGLAQDDPVLSSWPKLLEAWFRARGLLPMVEAPKP